jgi:hypothetical protein
MTASRCQKAAWKEHKTSCREELDVAEVWAKVADAYNRRDWEGVLAWEGKMEALLAGVEDDKVRVEIIRAFACAHGQTQNHAKAATYFERQVDLLGGMQLFRDQVMPKAYVSEHL